MKKKTVLAGIGAGTVILAAAAAVKKVLDKKNGDVDLNDEEMTKLVNEATDDDRGVGPVDDDSDDNDSDDQ